MIEYIYFVKCLDCEDEPFDFFDEAKAFALGKLSQKPEIHQTEVVRNDFGECTDSKDYGKIWSWNEVMNDIPDDNDTSVYNKADTFDCDDFDAEFNDQDITFETDCIIDKKSELNEDNNYPGYYGEEIFNMLDKMSGDHINSFLAEYRWFEPLGIDSLTDTSDKYDAISRYLDSDSGYRLYSNLDSYCYNNDLHESLADFKKPVPEGKTIKDLVEEMEENEDMVECKHCHDVFPKEDMLYELTRGYLCPICIMDLDAAGEELEFKPREIPEKVVDEEPLEESKKRTYDIFEDSVSFYYNDLEAVVQYNQTDADSWDEKYFYSDMFEYSIPIADFAEELWNLCLFDESYVDFQERYDEMSENDEAWIKFINNNIDTLMNRYSKQLFDKFESDAEEEYQKEVWKEWNDRYYESIEEPSSKENLLETLEESEEYKKRLMMCPECGDYSFDQETGICINCGFNTLD